MQNFRTIRIAVLAVLALVCESTYAQKTTSAISPVAAATSETAKANDAAPESFRDRYPRYKLRPGDAFDISFELSPEFNQSVSVQPDGFITLRSVGDVHVAGQTVPELTTTLRTAYAPILHDPLVSITLKDFEKPYFIADGQVGRPGKYDLRGDTTLTEAVAMAGGFLDSSKHSQVLLFRRVNDQWVSAKVIDVKKMQSEKNLTEDPLLHSGDMVFVPKNRLSKLKPLFPSASMGTFTKTY
ncbi:MAG TPA: polysaccharide biosynthesis/export family protein [Candidatus Acidoferrum sp.]|jgi:polysaccharide export outer membrane protein|nr:polysaccharide biosynthesis/export family protein [Candidatus Acidoferrum sp.]